MDNEDLPAYQRCLITTTFRTMYAIFTILIAISAFFGNSLILISIARFKDLRSGNHLHILIANLAVTDIVFAPVLIMYSMEMITTTLSNLKYFCLVRLSMLVTLLACSCGTITIITSHRLLVVSFPFLFHQRKLLVRKVILGLLACLWTGTIICGLIPIMGVNNYEQGFPVLCRNGPLVPDSVIISSTIVIIGFLSFNLLMYGVIIYKLLARKRIIGNTVHKTPVRTKLMAAICLSFTVCWLPYVLMSLTATKHKQVYCANEYLGLLGYVNAGINWIIYAVSDHKFKHAFKVLLCNNKLISKLKRVRNRETSTSSVTIGPRVTLRMDSMTSTTSTDTIVTDIEDITDDNDMESDL